MDRANEIDTGAQSDRKRIVDLLARATLTELETALSTLDPAPVFNALRGPETGLVMVKGRIGGGGARRAVDVVDPAQDHVSCQRRSTAVRTRAGDRRQFPALCR